MPVTRACARCESICRRMRSICWRMLPASSRCPAASARSISCASNRQRRFQSVREVARLRHGARDATLALVEQRVEVVDERRDFTRILAFEAHRLPVAHRRQPAAHDGERRQPLPHHDEGDDEKEPARDDRKSEVQPPNPLPAEMKTSPPSS